MNLAVVSATFVLALTATFEQLDFEAEHFVLSLTYAYLTAKYALTATNKSNTVLTDKPEAFISKANNQVLIEQYEC